VDQLLARIQAVGRGNGDAAFFQHIGAPALAAFVDAAKAGGGEGAEIRAVVGLGKGMSTSLRTRLTSQATPSWAMKDSSAAGRARLQGMELVHDAGPVRAKNR